MGSLETAAPGVTEQLSQWIHQTTLEHVPDSIQQRAKHLILDGIACGLVGARVPWSEEAFNALNQFEARGEHAIIGYDEVRRIALYCQITMVTKSIIISASVLLPQHSSMVHSFKPAS